jgi:hypothetical protein
MAAFVFSVCENPLSDISSVPLLINLRPPGLIKILDSHEMINQKNKGIPCQRTKMPFANIPKIQI